MQLKHVLAFIILAPGLAQAQTASLTVLYSFTGGADGNSPRAPLIADKLGDLYGTTLAGGTAGQGTIFLLNGKRQESVVYSFLGGTDGAFPQAGLIGNAAGDLFGTTIAGGAAQLGTVFELNHGGTETILHSFVGRADGATPSGPLATAAGSLFGTTVTGGAENAGIAYKLTTSGTETILHVFTNGTDGANPEGGLTANGSGIFYGTVADGGGAPHGAVFRVSATGVFNRLYAFKGGKDGSQPESNVTFDSAGNLYTTTSTGGIGGAGTAVEFPQVTTPNVLHGFGIGTDGANPDSAPIADSNGNLFGTTVSGGAFGYGTIYEIPAGGTEQVLYSFTGGPDGGMPMAGLIAGGNGIYYGTASMGGINDAGTVFQITTQ